MNVSHYEKKSINYGIGRTRLSRILKLAGPVHGKRVLDIGCAKGYLGKIFKDQGNYVAGVELSEQAAREARKNVDAVYSFNLEEKWPEEISNQKFDVIIMGEVIEHLFDPEKVLQKIRSIMSAEGSLIITTPNFMTWTNRVRFLFGKFRYEDQGMFDFGHIRFFTYDFLREVVRKAGLEIVDEKSIIFPGKLTAILKVWPSLFAWQFVVKAKIK